MKFIHEANEVVVEVKIVGRCLMEIAINLLS